MYTEIHLNEFATRCFRDTGDGDYVAARLAYRAQLVPQFLWSSLQAVEKYIKYILLINRIEGKSVRHDLGRGLKIIEQGAPFQLHLSDEALKFIEYLDTYGRYRYFETMYHYSGDELVFLDRAIWEIRRYCQPLNQTIERLDGLKRDFLEPNLKNIDRAVNRPPHKFRISNGALEKILDSKIHPSRAPLIWQNLYFGSRGRSHVKMAKRTGFSNSPLAKHPEMIEEVLKYVFLPKDVVRAFREKAQEKDHRGSRNLKKRMR